MILVLLTACASNPSRDGGAGGGAGSDSEMAEGEFQQGLKALEQEDYVEAARIFDQLLVQEPATELDLVTLYNSGAAHEGLGDCRKAADRYHQAVRSSANRFRRLEAMAFFRLSLMYECLGEDSKTITALLDARKRGSELSAETIQAEIPARLAAAYARIGNRDKAIEWFGRASTGLKTIVAKNPGRTKRDILGRTLFLMGQLNARQKRAEVDPKSYLQSLIMQQPYLLQAAELEHPSWSKKAADDLKMGYENIWKFKLEPEDRREFYIQGLQAAAELRKIRMPESGPVVNSIFARVDVVANKLKKELAKVEPTTPLTPEAKAREGLKRQGRLANPNPPSKPRSRKKP